jgi:hypothetical protein
VEGEKWVKRKEEEEEEEEEKEEEEEVEKEAWERTRKRAVRLGRNPQKTLLC